MYGFLQHLINGLAAGTIYALVALGYTMVYGVLKLINFAHGDVMMVGVYVGYATAFVLGREYLGTFTGVLLVFLVSMVACAAIGLVIERFAYRPLREKPRLTSLITAIGISFALSYGFQLDAVATFGSTKLTILPGAASRAFPEIIAPTQWLEIGSDEHSVIIWNWQVISLVISAALLGWLQLRVFTPKSWRTVGSVIFNHW